MKSTPLQSVRNILFCRIMHNAQQSKILKKQKWILIFIILLVVKYRMPASMYAYNTKNYVDLAARRGPAHSQLLHRFSLTVIFFIHAFVHNTNSHFSMQMHTRKKTDNWDLFKATNIYCSGEEWKNTGWICGMSTFLYSYKNAF